MANPSEPGTANTDLSAAETGPDFESRACEHLRSALPLETSGWSDDALRERVRSCSARCEAYALTSEEQILYFAGVEFLVGENFDSDPDHAWAAEVLQDAELSADERAAMLVSIAELLVEDSSGGE